MRRSFIITLFVLLVFLVGCDQKTTTQSISTVNSTVDETTELTTAVPTNPTTTVSNTYTVTWNVDGVAIEVDLDVLEGSMPVYNGVTPAKAETDQYIYTFSGWSPEIVAVSADVTYEAVFTETLRQYTLDFESNGGSLLGSWTLDYGTMLEVFDTPYREGYRFLGWFSDSELTTSIDFPYYVYGNQTLYAGWVEIIPYDFHLNTLFTSYKLIPYSFIPEAMRPMSNLVYYPDFQSVVYSDFTSTDYVHNGGFGEQWHMVVNNIEESKLFFNVLNVLDTLGTLSITAYNNHLDSNPGLGTTYEFESGIYSILIYVEDTTINYVLDYTTELEYFGEQTVQIAISMDYVNGVKEGRIQIGDENALRYVLTDDRYQLAIMYGGVRRTYYEVSKDSEDNIEGKVFEYLEVEGVFTLGSSAIFFVEDEYLSVVGNKSSSMIGWEGTINELYNAETGGFKGFEVTETLGGVTYNTLWFDVIRLSLVDNIKFIEASIGAANPHLVYINNQTEVFQTMLYGGVGAKMFSRRFDIEIRTQYFYYSDDSFENVYEVVAQSPMLFIQEEMLSSFQDDINELYPEQNIRLNVDFYDYNKLIDDNNTLVPIYQELKDEYTVEMIIEFIGDKYLLN